MKENSSVVWFRQPDEIDDPLTNILRSGARQLLAQAVEMEAEAFLAAMKDLAGSTPASIRRLSHTVITQFPA
jgi:putative transposase